MKKEETYAKTRQLGKALGNLRSRFERFPLQLLNPWPEADDHRNNPKRRNDEERGWSNLLVSDFSISSRSYSTSTHFHKPRKLCGRVDHPRRDVSPWSTLSRRFSREPQRKSRSKSESPRDVLWSLDTRVIVGAAMYALGASWASS